MKRIAQWVGKRILWIAAWLLCATLRIKKSNSSFFEEHCRSLKPSVIAFWHGSMLVGWFLHRPNNGQQVAALVSQSKDGEILSSTLEHWRYTLIRGSSHVGGKEAMQLMVETVKAGNALCVTPDGPTGPRHEMKMGAVRAAQRAQVPLFLVGIAVSRKKMLKSWDQFEVPFPFAKVKACYSDPIIVPPEYQDEKLDDFLRTTEKRFHELHQSAERSFATAAA